MKQKVIEYLESIGFVKINFPSGYIKGEFVAYAGLNLTMIYKEDEFHKRKQFNYLQPCKSKEAVFEEIKQFCELNKLNK